MQYPAPHHDRPKNLPAAANNAVADERPESNTMAAFDLKQRHYCEYR